MEPPRKKQGQLGSPAPGRHAAGRVEPSSYDPNAQGRAGGAEDDDDEPDYEAGGVADE